MVNVISKWRQLCDLHAPGTRDGWRGMQIRVPHPLAVVPCCSRRNMVQTLYQNILYRFLEQDYNKACL